MHFVQEYKEQLNITKTMKDKTIAIWGTGRVISSVYKILKENGCNILCFIDKDSTKQNKTIDNIPVVSADDKMLDKVDFIIISMRTIDKETLDAINKIKPAMSFNCYYILNNLDKFINIYDHIMADSCSKNVLKNILLANITADYSYCLDIFSSNQYYCLPEFKGVLNNYLVDVGAFVGDSIEKYIWLNPVFKKIYAIEPAKRQLKALKTRVKRLNTEWALNPDQIEIIEAAAGDKNESLKISINDDFANFNIFFNPDESSQTVKVVCLDSVLKNKVVDFIKADIEGAELKMLMGASNIIKQQKPKMALCVYHNINDLIDIIEYVKSIVPEYKMALRHHSTDIAETVLYCWIK